MNHGWSRSLLLFVVLLAPEARLHAQDAAGVLPPGAAVASANRLATDAGLEILAAGGNAFDAAVAVSSTLGLVEPESSGLGGGAFMLLRLGKEGRDVFIDAREKAPLAATRDMYLDEKGEPRRGETVLGARAAAIPGLPAGLVHLAGRYGRLPLARSFAPAIRLAEKGWPFGLKNSTMMGFRKDALAKNPVAAKLWLVDGKPPAMGTRMRNPDYAKTLRLIAAHGADGYYRGEFAERLVEGVRAGGGIWTLADLEQYRVVEREPLRFRYRDWEVVTAPPPSSGGAALMEMFSVLGGYDLAPMDRVARVHLQAEIMRRAYRDRAIYLGDPDFVKVPLALFASADYAAGLRASISLEKATPSALLPGVTKAPERPETTHFSIIDREGNLAAVTQTVNLPYGNCYSVAGTGFLLNDQMDDFSVKPGVPNAFGLVGEDANAIAPGKRPLSSMSPTFLFGKSRTALLGTPGGSRIISQVFVGLLSLMDGRAAQETVDMPRFHHQYLPDQISAEQGAFTAEEIAALQARGHAVAPSDNTWGNMNIVMWDKDLGKVTAASDPRWKGVGKGDTAGGEVFR